MTELLKPNRGGFLRPFGCGWFIREFLLGNGPYGTPGIDPTIGAPQADIFYHYKNALRRVTAEDRATRFEEKRARKQRHPIDPGNIEKLTNQFLNRLPYKASGCRYHSLVVYFSTLKRLGWVEESGIKETSAFQGNYPPGNPRIFYRLTVAGKAAADSQWMNPQQALYG
jgi:hypothetical protein